ncbi:hypothetical protein ACHAWF_015349 [Thalassiosira exigua]
MTPPYRSLMAFSSRRRIPPPDTLATFGAAPIYPQRVVGDDGSSAVADRDLPLALETQLRARTRSSEKSASSEKILPSGIRIGGWEITTQNSAIGDEQRMEELTVLLEETANSVSTNNHRGECGWRRRRLCPPEITFLDAVITFQYKCDDVPREVVDNAHEILSELRFTARDALLEWAEAHMKLKSRPDEPYCSESARDESRGVSILKTADAKIWSSKRDNVDAPSPASTSSEFYYDWTFSSPYAGSVCPHDTTDAADVRQSINNRGRWQPLQHSHIPFSLLRDTSQPILLFDDIHLYEDDLHDNGDVSLNIKVRVMPRCWYVLQQLFVRVDRVRVRCREVRYFCLFDDRHGEPGVKPNTIYRDVAWKEASWDQLGRMALPVDPSAWTENGKVGSVVPGTPTLPPLASLLTRLPAVPLPDDLPQYSYLTANISKHGQ